MVDDLQQWFSERPIWLQIAAERLFEKAILKDEDIQELSSICLQEVEGKLKTTSCTLPASDFSQDSQYELRLSSISDIDGVNALAPRKPLEFGKANLTIVYGDNGSGKSGYVRLLKHACGARNLDPILRNIYKKEQSLQKACITYEKNSTEKDYIWTGKTSCNELGSVDIFDTSFGRIFVTNEDEVSYEPPILSFFSQLIEICEKVTNVLDIEIRKYPSKKPYMPSELKITVEGRWYDVISLNTTSDTIEKYSFFDSECESKMQTLLQRLSEQAPAEKAKKLKRQKLYVDTLTQDVQKYLQQMSDENCRRIISAKKESIIKRKAADTAAENMFSGSHLQSIGSEIWKELWEAARKYSLQEAYVGSEYPNIAEDSRCVLCHQKLDPEAKDRLNSFENFVKGEMQRAALAAAKEYDEAIKTIDDIPSSESLRTTVDATGIQQDGIIDKVIEFFAQLQERKDIILKLTTEDEIPIATPLPKWIDEAISYSNSLDELSKKYEKDAKEDNRDEIKKELNSLQARKWLSEHRAAIEEEITRFKLLNKINAAKRRTNTKSFSQKKGELAEAMITDAFVQRFNNELKNLGASHIKVEFVKVRVSKGKVLHKLQLRGAAQRGLSDVLSEGENRIISIAAFLADVTGKVNKSPFIFDDPISSLDQNYEEAVVKRLIELSQDRQVIIFTHRLSLLGTVRHYAEKYSIKPGVVSIRTVEWGTGEPAPIPLSHSDIKTSLNTLMNQRFQDIKKANEEGNFSRAEIELKSICSDFRILIERSIESDLLCGVVQRFQRPVHTLKLKDLAKLKSSDCSLLDGLMTKYSYFEHSQPIEAPIPLPPSDEVLDDMKSLAVWRNEYANRSAL